MSALSTNCCDSYDMYGWYSDNSVLVEAPSDYLRPAVYYWKTQ